MSPKAAGKAEKVHTITKISQTWLASQTGPSEAAIRPRWRSALPRSRPSPASMSQPPPPKSAPASRA